MLRLKEISIVESKEQLAQIPLGKVLINTINAYSFNVAQDDATFAEALQTVHGSGFNVQGALSCVKYLIPDGASIVSKQSFRSSHEILEYA